MPGPEYINLVPLGYEFITVTEYALMAVGLDAPEFDPDLHPDFDLIHIAVGNLRQQFDAVFEFSDTDRIGSLIGELRRGNANHGIGQQLAGIGQNDLFEFTVAAFGADQTVWEDNLTTLGAFTCFEAITVFAISPYS